jgi:hypothetical protein
MTKRSKAQQSDQERAALSRLRQILIEPPLMHATWIRHRRVCGQKTCSCATDRNARHVNWYIAQTRNRKTRMKYVPPELYQEIRRWVSRYWEVRALLDKLSESAWKQLHQLKR